MGRWGWVAAPPRALTLTLSRGAGEGIVGGGLGGWLWRGVVGPRSAPGIPRSHRCARSRPFRAAKGAVRVVVMGWNGGLVGVLSEPLIALIFVMGFDWVLVGGWVGGDGISGGLVGGAPLHPGHPPLAALRWLAPPYAARRGRLLVAVGVVAVVEGVMVWLVWRPPVRPGHTPLASLRSLAPPYALRKGRCVLW